MTEKLPVLFVSHGSPMMAVEDSPSATFLRQLSKEWPTPRAILVVSAHWETLTPSLTGSTTLQTIHDFYGFPPTLYRLRYPAKGDPVLARRIKDLLMNAEMEASIDDRRGLDHGAWNPLMCIYPQANIPVVQLSVQSHAPAQWHYEIGRALRTIRKEGVLVIGSGNLTHNLREAFHGDFKFTPEWVTDFSEWIWQKTQADDHEALISWRELAPHAGENHPTPEHFLPFLVALGAADHSKPHRLNQVVDFGVLAMDAYLFSD